MRDALLGTSEPQLAGRWRDEPVWIGQAAIAHAQFETLHPFPNGNGRTGRALAHSLLHAKGLTRKVSDYAAS